MSSGILNDAELRGFLLALGDAILPIAAWLPANNPAPWPGAPWRTGAVDLNMATLAALEMLDRLISQEDHDLEQRWSDLMARPFAKFPEGTPEAWRAARGLPSTNVVFCMNAANWPTIVNPTTLYSADVPPAPLIGPLYASRAALYGASWAPLKAVGVAAGANPDWAQLAIALRDGVAADWPAAAPPSARFLRTFARDLLICVMTLKNTEAGPLADALLVELREGRRPGNSYNRQDVDAARAALEAKLREVLRATPAPLVELGA